MGVCLNMVGKKQYQMVTCKDCLNTYNKRKDSLKNWNGSCNICSVKAVSKLPKMKEVYRNNGLQFIAKYGKIPPPKLENRKRGSEHHFWGSKRCGEISPNWQGGKSSENSKIRSSIEYKEWRIAVFKRDNYTCTFCGDNKGGNLNADHIQPFAIFKELRFDIDNGRTLCEPCHDKFGAKVNNGIITRKAIFKHIELVSA